MSRHSSLRGRWQNLRVSATQMTAGGSWSVQLSKATQRNLRYFFFDGVFASASDSIVLTYMTLFVLALGGSSADIGLMTALASLSATLLLIPGAMLVDRVGARKQIVLISGGFVSRIFLLLLALIPLFSKGPAAIYIAIAFKVAMDAARNLGLPAWVSMTADIVPLSWRGRYFGTRNVVMGIAAMVMTYGIGQLITFLGSPIGYQWALGLSFILGMFSTASFGQLREPKDTETPTPRGSYSLGALLLSLRADSNFLAFCIYTALWTFSLNIAGPFFSVYLAKDLKATASIIGVIAVVGKISAIPAQRVFGPLADRWGPRKLMRLMGSAIPLLPIAWWFVRAPWNAIPINIVGGILWAGYNLAAFNLLLELSPPDQRARYSAIYQIAVAISTAFGASLGGLVANRWGIPLIFLLSGAGRILAAGVFSRFVHPPKTRPKGLLTEP